MRALTTITKVPIQEVQEELENQSPPPAARTKRESKKKSTKLIINITKNSKNSVDHRTEHRSKGSLSRSKSIESNSSLTSSPKLKVRVEKSPHSNEEMITTSRTSSVATTPHLSRKKVSSETPKISPDTSPMQRINHKFLIPSPDNHAVVSPKHGRGWTKLKSKLLRKDSEIGSAADHHHHDHDDQEISYKKPSHSPTQPESKKSTKHVSDKKAIELLHKNEQKIVKFMSMYKIEKKKQEELSNINKELETRIARDARLIAELQQMISELKENQANVPTNEKLEKITKKIDDRTKHIQKLNELRPQLINENLVDDDDEVDNAKVVTLKSLDKSQTMEILPRERRHSGRGLQQLGVNRKLVAIEKHNFAAMSIIAKLKLNFQRKLAKLKGVVPVKAVLKQINSFYMDRFHMTRENPIVKEQDMATFVYRQFINTFGFQRFALEKFNKFAMSVKKHSQVPRVNKFARMMGLLDEGQNYSFDEIKQYLAGMDFLMSATHIGVNYPNNEYEKRHFVPWVRAAEYIRVFGEKRMRPEELQDFKKECEKLKMPDPTHRNNAGIVDIDEFLEKIIIRYKVMMNRGKETWMTAFKAADLDNDKKVTISEFSAILKYMETEKYDEKKIEEIFTTQYDIVDGDNVALSFERFLSVAFEYNIFSEMKQDQFLGIVGDYEIKEIFKGFAERWGEEKTRLINVINEKRKVIHADVAQIQKSSCHSMYLQAVSLGEPP